MEEERDVEKGETEIEIRNENGRLLGLWDYDYTSSSCL